MKAVIKIFIIAALFFSSMTAWALRAENFSSPDLNAHNSTVVLFTGEGIVTGSATSSFNSGFDFSREETAGKEDDADYLVDFVFVSNEGVNLGNEGSTSLNSTGR
ncbi:MAG: hypothetical protein RIB86_00395, partial [Imperialibacter sp.]